MSTMTTIQQYLQASLRDELERKEVENNRLRERLRELEERGQTEKVKVHSQLPAPVFFNGMHFQQVSFQFPLRLTWRRAPDMPFEMAVNVQSVLADGKLYVRGGVTISGDAYTVMEYDCRSEQWATLSPYRTCYFAMAVSGGRLVLVGGREDNEVSKVVGVWRLELSDWSYPYPEMPNARYYCSAAAYKQWLVVIGGEDAVQYLSSVDLLNTSTKQWYTGCPMPVPLYSMKIDIVDDILYLMGGCIKGGPTDKVYSASVPNLISHIKSISTCGNNQTWEEIPGLQLINSSPLSINGSLLAVGGWDRVGRQAVTAIHLYHPESREWVKVGDLPSPCYNCTCAVSHSTEIVVAGGRGADGMWLKKMDIASLSH